MTIDELREVHQARPFVPFTLQLADGNEVEVPHPECMSYRGRGRVIAVAVSEDIVKFIDLMLVASIQVGPPKRRTARRRS